MEATCLSHACGNESHSSMVREISFLFVPRMWEWVERSGETTDYIRVCPTHVGMSRKCNTFCLMNSSLSHACGNESPLLLPEKMTCQFVPRRWEWVEMLAKMIFCDKVCPTRVGMSRVCQTELTDPWLFIPREWEWVVGKTNFKKVKKVYPTHVGMSRFRRSPLFMQYCLSHACGNESQNAFFPTCLA